MPEHGSLAAAAREAELVRWWVRATHNAVLVTLSVALGALALGLVLGALAVYSAHGVGVALSRLVEISGALPSLILIGVLRPWDPSGGVLALVGTLGCSGRSRWRSSVRTHVVSARLSDFVLASRALGASRRWQISRPHPARVAGPTPGESLAFGASSVIGLEAALSFTGLGLPADVPSWGGGLGQLHLGESPGPFLLVAFSIALTSGALYALGARLAARFDSPLRGVEGPRIQGVKGWSRA